MERRFRVSEGRERFRRGGGGKMEREKEGKGLRKDEGEEKVGGKRRKRWRKKGCIIAS